MGFPMKNGRFEVHRNGYGSIPINTIFSWDEHPFTSYFDVHQRYKVLTHCQITVLLMAWGICDDHCQFLLRAPWQVGSRQHRTCVERSPAVW